MPDVVINKKPDYQLLWDTMTVMPSKKGEVDAVVRRILANQKRYEALNTIIRVPYPHSIIPWQFIAVVHKMEANLGFGYHLHNGDPLTARTRQVPKGRPVKGNPPFTWEQSAFDALCNVAGLHKVTDWSIPSMLFRLEGYNGYGYQKYHPDVLTPYLWSYSNHYSRGKYTADGHFDINAVSTQLGAAVLLNNIL